LPTIRPGHPAVRMVASATRPAGPFMHGTVAVPVAAGRMAIERRMVRARPGGVELVDFARVSRLTARKERGEARREPDCRI